MGYCEHNKVDQLITDASSGSISDAEAAVVRVRLVIEQRKA